MRLPDQFRLTLRGNLFHVISRENVGEGVGRLLTHILKGGEFSSDLLRSWGITCEAAEDLDVTDPAAGLADMCNLYRHRTALAETARLFDAVIAAEFEWKADIYPRYTAPVIISHEGKRRIGPMMWGFPMEINGRATKYVTNARNLTSSFWKPSAIRPARRCLVPFTQFAEPKPGKDPEGRPAQYWFKITDQPVACFAGLWRKMSNGNVFAFCTTDPNPLIAPLHPKAMPVILLPEDHDRWLTGDFDDVIALQTPYPSQLMAVD